MMVMHQYRTRSIPQNQKKDYDDRSNNIRKVVHHRVISYCIECNCTSCWMNMVFPTTFRRQQRQPTESWLLLLLSLSFFRSELFVSGIYSYDPSLSSYYCYGSHYLPYESAVKTNQETTILTNLSTSLPSLDLDSKDSTVPIFQENPKDAVVKSEGDSNPTTSFVFYNSTQNKYTNRNEDDDDDNDDDSNDDDGHSSMLSNNAVIVARSKKNNNRHCIIRTTTFYSTSDTTSSQGSWCDVESNNYNSRKINDDGNSIITTKSKFRTTKFLQQKKRIVTNTVRRYYNTQKRKYMQPKQQQRQQQYRPLRFNGESDNTVRASIIRLRCGGFAPPNTTTTTSNAETSTIDSRSKSSFSTTPSPSPSSSFASFSGSNSLTNRRGGAIVVVRNKRFQQSNNNNNKKTITTTNTNDIGQKLIVTALVTLLFEATIGHILEFLKIVMQTSTSTSSLSYVRVITDITSTKGIFALWDGFCPWGIIQALFKGAVFGVAHAVATKLFQPLVQNNIVPVSIAATICGGIGGGFQGYILSPTLLLKTRVMTDPIFRSTDSTLSTYETTILSFQIGYKVVTNEGLIALMKGSNVFALKRVFDWSTRYYFSDLVESFMLYLKRSRKTTVTAETKAKATTRKVSSITAATATATVIPTLTVYEKSIASLLGGILSTVSTLPLDVLVAKIQDAKQAGVSINPITLFVQELNNKGWIGLQQSYLRGFEARLLHVCLTTVVVKTLTPIVYELLFGSSSASTSKQ